LDAVAVKPKSGFGPEIPAQQGLAAAMRMILE
jgi:hypothetical protein